MIGAKKNTREQSSGTFTLLAGCIWIALFLISGCATGPTIHKVSIGASHDLTPPASVSKSSVGIFHDPTYAKYVHKQSISDSLATTDIGVEGVDLFNIAIPMTFEKSQLVFEMPPFAPKVYVDGFVEPRLDYVNWRMFFDKEQEFFHVGYKFIFYTADGIPLSTWGIDGEGKYLKHQLADAAQQFINDFQTAPETSAFREYLSKKRIDNLAFNAEDIDVDAQIIEENPLGLNLKAAGVIPIQVTIRNGTSQDVTSSGYFAHMTHGGVHRLIPAFPLAIVSEFEYLAAINANDPATAGAFFGMAGLMGSMFGSHSERVEIRKKQSNYFESTRLKEVTLKSGETTKGMLYFILPEFVTNLDNAEFSMWFVNPAAANGVMKNIELKDIGYIRPAPPE